MGITAQRRWRMKQGLEPERVPSPPPLPPTVPRADHERALRELTIQYESKLQAARSEVPEEVSASLRELSERLEAVDSENRALRERVAELEAELKDDDEDEDDPEAPSDGPTPPPGQTETSSNTAPPPASDDSEKPKKGKKKQANEPSNGG